MAASASESFASSLSSSPPREPTLAELVGGDVEELRPLTCSPWDLDPNDAACLAMRLLAMRAQAVSGAGDCAYIPICQEFNERRLCAQGGGCWTVALLRNTLASLTVGHADTPVADGMTVRNYVEASATFDNVIVNPTSFNRFCWRLVPVRARRTPLKRRWPKRASTIAW